MKRESKFKLNIKLSRIIFYSIIIYLFYFLLVNHLFALICYLIYFIYFIFFIRSYFSCTIYDLFCKNKSYLIKKFIFLLIILFFIFLSYLYIYNIHNIIYLYYIYYFYSIFDLIKLYSINYFNNYLIYLNLYFILVLIELKLIYNYVFLNKYNKKLKQRYCFSSFEGLFLLMLFCTINVEVGTSGIFS